MMHMKTPPTPKPIRVTVPVSPEVLAVFQRLSKAAGQSVGRSMGGWLEETMEGVAPMIDILERHKQAPKKAIQALQLYAGTVQDMSNDLFDKVRAMPTDGSDSAVARRSLTEAAQTLGNHVKQGLTPPSSNTGGKGRKTAKSVARGSK